MLRTKTRVLAGKEENIAIEDTVSSLPYLSFMCQDRDGYMLIRHQTTTTTVEINAPSTGEEYNMEPALDPWLVAQR